MAVVPAQAGRHATERALGILDDGHPDGREDLGRGRLQRQRPAHDQPRELIDEQRRPRPLSTNRAWREDLDRQLLVIALVALAPKPRLVTQIDHPLAHAVIAVGDVVALHEAQLPRDRAPQRLHVRHDTALGDQLAMHRGDIAAPRHQQLERPIGQHPRRTVTTRTSLALRQPPVHRPRRHVGRRGRLADHLSRQPAAGHRAKQALEQRVATLLDLRVPRHVCKTADDRAGRNACNPCCAIRGRRYARPTCP